MEDNLTTFHRVGDMRELNETTDRVSHAKGAKRNIFAKVSLNEKISVHFEKSGFGYPKVPGSFRERSNPAAGQGCHCLSMKRKIVR